MTLYSSHLRFLLPVQVGERKHLVTASVHPPFLALQKALGCVVCNLIVREFLDKGYDRQPVMTCTPQSNDKIFVGYLGI